MPLLPVAFLPATGGAVHPSWRTKPLVRARRSTQKRARPRPRPYVLSPIRADLSDDHPLMRIPQLQNALDEAVEEEQYATAASLRDELLKAQNEESVMLLTAVLRYYEAFNDRSLNLMRKLWRDDIPVSCQQPVGSCVTGHPNVLASYRQQFVVLPQDLKIEFSDVQIANFGTAAVITCVESPLSASISTEKINHLRLVVTALYEKVWDASRQKFEFKLVHHVKSPLINGTDMM